MSSRASVMKLGKLVMRTAKMKKFWDAWTASTISVGRMKASGFGVIFLTVIAVVALVV